MFVRLTCLRASNENIKIAKKQAIFCIPGVKAHGITDIANFKNTKKSNDKILENPKIK